MAGSKPTILVASIGSYGDVLPFVTLGRSLLDQGFSVKVMTSGYFRDRVEALGMTCVPIGTADEYRAYISNPNWTHPIRSLFLNRAMLYKVLEPTLDYLRSEYRQSFDYVVSASHFFAARLAYDMYQLPFLSFNLSPIMLGSLVEPVTISPRLRSERIPRCLRKNFGRLFHTITDRMIGKPINALRAKHGLTPIRRVLQWIHSPLGSYSFFPDWFYSVPVDGPKNHESLGFPKLLTEPKRIDDELEQVLSDSRRPLLFTPGSSASHIDDFIKTSARICDRLDRRGILLAPACPTNQVTYSSRLIHRSFVPLASILPRVAFAIQHGGIGTIAATIQAGVPQLLRPIFADQPENAACVERLGLGVSLPSSAYQASKVAKLIEQQLGDTSVAETCRRFADRANSQNGIDGAVQRIRGVFRL
jgi:rhamnosyltransferase subunit B